MRVECLCCGKVRDHEPRDECPRCGYVGWAPPQSLTEQERRLVRERPPELRRLRHVA